MVVVQKDSRVEVEVAATAEQVWGVVSDVTRTGEWSHECTGARWLDGARAPAVGVRFRGSNRTGRARWSRTCELVTVEPPVELVWHTVPTLFFPDSTQWRIHLEPRGDRTLITQSFTVLRAPWLLDRVYARMLPSHQDRSARLAEDLERLGAVAAR